MRVIRAAMPVLLAVVLAAGPAEARRFRFFGGGGGGGGSETITRVKDLPDRDPYLRDGEAWDVGYLNSFRQKGGYVLYHGDAYIRLDDKALELLEDELGYDPTAAHRTAAEATRKAAVSTSDNVVERRPGESREAFAERARRELADKTAGSSFAAEAKSAGAGGTAGRMLLALLIGGIGLFAVLKMARSAFRPSARTTAEEGEPEPVDTTSFDQRVAQRLAAMRGGAAEPEAAMSPAGPRTFGRRAG